MVINVVTGNITAGGERAKNQGTGKNGPKLHKYLV